MQGVRSGSALSFLGPCAHHPIQGSGGRARCRDLGSPGRVSKELSLTCHSSRKGGRAGSWPLTLVLWGAESNSRGCRTGLLQVGATTSRLQMQMLMLITPMDGLPPSLI